MTTKKLRTWGDNRKPPLTGEPIDLDAAVQQALDAFYASGGKLPPKPKRRGPAIHCGYKPCNKLFTPRLPNGLYCSALCSQSAWNAKRRKA